MLCHTPSHLITAALLHKNHFPHSAYEKAEAATVNVVLK